MGYSKISELRELLSLIPLKVITSAQRFILHTINSYQDDNDPKGACWIGYERMSREIGKSPRGVFADLKKLKAMGLVGTRVKHSRVGFRQQYFVIWDRLREIGSVNSDSYLKLSSMYQTDLEGELTGAGVGTPLPTYKQDKDNKQLNNFFFIEEIRKLMPYTQRVNIKDRFSIDTLLSIYLTSGGSKEKLLERFREVKWREVSYPQRFLESELNEAIKALKGA